MNTVLVADGQEICCLGILHILQANADFKFLDYTSTSEDLFNKISALTPDILLIDIDTLSNFKPEDLTTIKQKYSGLKVCVISANTNKDNIYKLLELGVTNYIVKDCDVEELKMALNATANNQKYYSSFILDVLVNKKVNPSSIDKKSLLTIKEIEIINLIAQGLTTKDIATKLFISHHTVITHRKNIFRKIEVNSVSELIRYSIKAGILDFIEYYI